MNATEIKTTARAATIALLTDVFTAADAVQFADASWAILQNVDGQEVWTEITVKSKAYKPTKKSPEFDPFVAQQEWQADKEIKAKEDAEKAAKKAKAKKEKEKADE